MHFICSSENVMIEEKISSIDELRHDKNLSSGFPTRPNTNRQTGLDLESRGIVLSM